jgi:hypothetical protein
VTDDNGIIEVADFVPVDRGDGIKDFSFSLEPKRFRINDDVFEAAPALPLGLAGQLAGFKDMLAENAVDKVLGFFDLILLEGSDMRFRERAMSKREPIPLTRVMPIINWFLEEYGLRPTAPSAPSSSTSESADGSTPSTAGASPEGSTGPGSPSQGS